MYPDTQTNALNRNQNTRLAVRKTPIRKKGKNSTIAVVKETQSKLPIPTDKGEQQSTRDKMTDKDWAERIGLEAFKNNKHQRFYTTTTGEVKSEAEATQIVEDTMFDHTGDIPEERQIRKILKASIQLSDQKGESIQPVYYRVGKTAGNLIAIDLCNTEQQYLVLDTPKQDVKVFKKDQPNDVPCRYRVLFYTDDNAQPLLESKHVKAVRKLVKSSYKADTCPEEIYSYNPVSPPIDAEEPTVHQVDIDADFELNVAQVDFRALYSNLSDNDFWLLRGWMAYTLMTPKTQGNVFPILFLQADLGEGKTVIFRQLLHSLTDPRKEGVVRFNKNLETTGLLLNHGHTLLLDNMRQLSKEQSDFFCNVATGSNEFKRQLYKDGDLFGSELHGAVAMNGIHDTITEPDLISRTLFIKLQPPRTRLDEVSLQRYFDQNRPWFFAVILRDVMRIAEHLDTYPNGVVDNNSRLVRFSRSLAALDCYRNSETSLPHLMMDRQQDHQHAFMINDSLVEALYATLAESDGEYRGTSTQLLELLNDKVDEAQRPGWWPAKAQSLYYRLQDREHKLRLLKIISSYDQPELLCPRKGEVVYQITDFNSAES